MYLEHVVRPGTLPHMQADCAGKQNGTFGANVREVTNSFLSADIYSGEWQDLIWVHAVMDLHPLFHASCTMNEFSTANS